MDERAYIETQLKLLRVRRKIKEYKESHAIEFFTPWAHQQKLLDYLHAGKKTLLAQGANRIGKTVIGACMVGSVCQGFQPWDKKPLPPPFVPPVKVRILCANWEHHAKGVIVPALKSWLVEGSYETRKNNVGIDYFFKFNDTKSTVELITHVQDTRAQEGWHGHFIWADEPPPRDKYVANKRGLVDFDGVFLLTMTAVYETWILKEIVRKGGDRLGYIGDVPIEANPLLSKEAIAEYAESIPEDEREARLRGGWLQLSGLVVKTFNAQRNVIDRIDKLPPEWPVIAIIDYHTSKPQAVGFYAFDKYNREYVIDEIWDNMSAKETADEIIRRKRKNNWNITHAFIDPLAKGDAAYLKQRGIEVEDTFTIIKNALLPFEVELSIASKDKESGISNLNAGFKGAAAGANIFICRNCKRHIEQISDWCYDQKTEKPKKENDHFCENLYRSTLVGANVFESFTSKKANYTYHDIGIV